jgi:hypothetical protein
MSESSNEPVSSYQGPLHLQRFLQTPCPEIEKAIRDAVSHSINSLRGLYCDCRTSAAMRAIPPTEEEASKDPVMAEARRRALEQSKAKINLRQGLSEDEGRALPACKFFYIKLNDEAGIYHAICRRCQRVVNVYDRDLYWGTPRKSDKPPMTFPYNCGCGGHAFEVGVGFSYPPEALDENDIDTLTVAVRCATCDETAVIFDDEAT